MEDVVVVSGDLVRDPSASLLLVLDGHGGAQVRSFDVC
jgi:hypothetical protein